MPHRRRKITPAIAQKKSRPARLWWSGVINNGYVIENLVDRRQCAEMLGCSQVLIPQVLPGLAQASMRRQAAIQRMTYRAPLTPRRNQQTPCERKWKKEGAAKQHQDRADGEGLPKGKGVGLPSRHHHANRQVITRQPSQLLQTIAQPLVHPAIDKFKGTRPPCGQ